MGNWKKKHERKRRRIEDGQRGDGSVPGTASGEKEEAPAERNFAESAAQQTSETATSHHSAADFVASLRIPDCALLDAITERVLCPYCNKSTHLFCPTCLFLHPGLKEKGSNALRTSLLLKTNEFPLKLHIVMHPTDKLQKSSVAGLKFLCPDYQRENWWSLKSVDALPWISTSMFSSSNANRPRVNRQDGKHQAGGVSENSEGGTLAVAATVKPAFEANVSPSMFKDLDEFFDSINPDDCVLLFPANDATSVQEVFASDSSGAVSSTVSSPASQPKVAILLDCTWFQTAQMLNHPILQRLRKVKIDSHKTIFWRHHGRRGNGDPDLSDEHLSTVEAAYWLVREAYTAASYTAAPSGASGASESSVDGAHAAYDGRFDKMLIWFVNQWETIQTAYRSTNRDFQHKKNWVVRDEKPQSESVNPQDERRQ